jgi:hypothetical protein
MTGPGRTTTSNIGHHPLEIPVKQAKQILLAFFNQIISAPKAVLFLSLIHPPKKSHGLASH